MRLTIIPKRKLHPSETESLLLSEALSYIAKIVDGNLDSLSIGTTSDLATHAADTTTHGATGAIVGTTNSQTLTSKTFTAPTITSGSYIAGAGTGSNGFLLKDLKNSTASGLSGTQKDIQIYIGGVPYYFTVYPTKA